MTIPDNKLTWNYFECLHKDKRLAFERLCRTLFLHEFCDENTILLSGPNNPGIETSPVWSNKKNANIGFQAKFFDNKTGYRQIKNSAKKTLKYYKGQIDKLVLFCNMEIDTTSQQYQEIYCLLSEHNIELIVCSNDSIFDLLRKYSDIAALYFNTTDFNDNWFKERVKTSINELGKRYNHVFNIATTTEEVVDFFLMKDTTIAKINNHKKQAIEAIDHLYKNKYTNYNEFLKSLQNHIKSLPDVNYQKRELCLSWFDIICEEFKDNFKEIKEAYKERTQQSSKNVNYDELNYLKNLLDLPCQLFFSEHEKCYISSNILFLKGEAGIGKSQLLATIADYYIKNSLPVCLLLGHKFFNYSNIETAILALLGISDMNINDLLSAFNELGLQNQQPTLILIDAINESFTQKFWKDNLTQFVSLIRKYPNIRVIMSYREDYRAALLDQHMQEKISKYEIAEIKHLGLLSDDCDNVSKFLEQYDMPFEPEYYLQNHMHNPLYLTWFCQSNGNSGYVMYDLMDKTIEKADEDAKKCLNNLSEDCHILENLLNEISEIFLKTNLYSIEEKTILNLSVWETYGLTQEKTKYLSALCKFGLLIKYKNNEKESYYIGYNLLNDYCLAKHIINKYQQPQKLKNYIENDLLKIENNKITKQSHITLCSMICALYADKFQELDLSFISNLDLQSKHCFGNSYIDTYKWRKRIEESQFKNFCNKFTPSSTSVFELLIENATKIDNPLNAIFLHELLSKLVMPKRDCFWTIYVNGLGDQNQIYKFMMSIKTGRITSLKNQKQTFLVLILFGWFLTSTNRKLRDHTSKAMIEILRRNLQLCQQLLEKFEKVNEPYVLQRLYGVVLGACLKQAGENKSIFKRLAKYIYNTIFEQDEVYPDILLRDYARLVVERYAYEYPDDLEEINILKIRPPYKSEPIPKPNQIKKVNTTNEFLSGTNQIIHSMAFETTPGYSYGDFGRYKFQYAVEKFNNIDINQIHDYGLDFIFNTLRYNEELFGKYDTNNKAHASFNRYEHNIERIGKKYQWIAFYNIMARISDSYQLTDSYYAINFYKQFQGVCQLFIRDFDPTQNIANKHYYDNESPIRTIFVNSNNFINHSTTNQKEINSWLIRKPICMQDLTYSLIDKEQKWVTLYISTSIKDENNQQKNSRPQKGNQHIDFAANSFILPTANFNKFKKILETDNLLNPETKYELFCREFTWSPSCKDVNIQGTKLDELRNLSAIPTTQKYRWESEYDASLDAITEFAMPSNELIDKLKLSQFDEDGYFCDKLGNIVAYDLHLEDGYFTQFVIKKDVLDEFLTKNKLILVWQTWSRKVYYTKNDSYDCGVHDTKGYCQYYTNLSFKFHEIKTHNSK